MKATEVADGVETRPDRILAAAWEPQRRQIMAGIYKDLFLVAFTPPPRRRLLWIDRVPAHILQATPEVMEPRAPLSPTAKRAGWRGFIYDLTKIPLVGFEGRYPPT